MKQTFSKLLFVALVACNFAAATSELEEIKNIDEQGQVIEESILGRHRAEIHIGNSLEEKYKDCKYFVYSDIGILRGFKYKIKDEESGTIQYTNNFDHVKEAMMSDLKKFSPPLAAAQVISTGLSLAAGFEMESVYMKSVCIDRYFDLIAPKQISVRPTSFLLKTALRFTLASVVAAGWIARDLYKKYRCKNLTEEEYLANRKN